MVQGFICVCSILIEGALYKIRHATPQTTVEKNTTSISPQLYLTKSHYVTSCSFLYVCRFSREAPYLHYLWVVKCSHSWTIWGHISAVNFAASCDRLRELCIRQTAGWTNTSVNSQIDSGTAQVYLHFTIIIRPTKQNELSGQTAHWITHPPHFILSPRFVQIFV